MSGKSGLPKLLQKTFMQVLVLLSEVAGSGVMAVTVSGPLGIAMNTEQFLVESMAM